MAGNLKKVFIIGNVGHDPDIRYTNDGTPVASFSVAVNERTRRAQGQVGGQGEQQDEPPTWFRVSAWRRQAEIVSEIVHKGMTVFVSGDLTVREFTGNDGQRRMSLDVRMDDLQLLTPKGAGENGSFDERPTFGAGPSTGGTPAGIRGATAGGVDDVEDDSEIPF